MVENFRHHRASRDVQVIIVPVPCGGSPEPLGRQPPPAYKRNQWSPWRPRRYIPSKRIVKLMRELAKREADARSMLIPRPDLMRAWFAKAA